MAINMKAGKKMKGLMCQSHASTAVCMSQDQRSSVIVPRSSVDRKLADNDLVNRSRKYIRLGELQGHTAFPVPAIRRSSYPVPVVSSLKKCSEKMMPQQAVTPPTANALALSNNVFQVVVMRVSIHCQGCAGKVKKHISKMEGVTSYSIDLESKRVTVMGHVSPSGVLESISKVKKAEFWPAC